MGDRLYYPDRWREFCSLVKNGSIEPSQSWSIFAARYRVAGNYAGSSFFQMSNSISTSYSEAIRFLLCYSAFEAACSASSIAPASYHMKSDYGYALEARKLLIKAFSKSSETTFPLKQFLENQRLKSKIDDFFGGKDDNLVPIAMGLRHLFAHGVWTPYGAEAFTKTACEALDLLSQCLLRAGDQILDHFLQRSQGA